MITTINTTMQWALIYCFDKYSKLYRLATLKKILVISCLSILLLNCNENSIRLGTTSTLQDSGLLAVLVDTYNASHDNKVVPVVAGSGHIFTLIERDDIDIAITHEPQGEQALVARKLVKQRQPLMRNYFVLVGPKHDPAHIESSITVDEALKKIANTHNTWISRNDNSGTHLMEKHWWNIANLNDKTNHVIRTGTGMGASLAVAVERDAYTLVDIATWLHFDNKESLRILFDDADLLPNFYSVLHLNTATTTVSSFIEWLDSDSTQQLINQYRINNTPVFFIESPNDKS